MPDSPNYDVADGPVTPGRFHVRAATAADVGTTVDVLARAFIDDPAMAYLFPDLQGRPERLRRFFALTTAVDPRPGDWTLAAGADGVPVAAALWRPPGVWSTPASALVRAVPQLLTTFGWGLRRALGVLGEMERHHPRAPHWYLQYLGAVPAAQGQGFGGAAIRARLARCDAEGMPAALETATESNLGFYRALGFEVTDSFEIRGGPRFWGMWRVPRS